MNRIYVIFVCIMTVLIEFSVFAGTTQDLGKWEKGELLLENYSFEDGLAAWNLEDGTCCERGAQYTWEIDDDNPQHGEQCLKVVGHIASGMAWHAKINQQSVSMKSGEGYTIIFWARAEAPRDVNINVQMQADPWTTFHGQGKTFNLTTDWEEYFFTFIASTDIDRQMWVGLAIAQSDVDFWLDNFRYFEGEPEDDMTIEEVLPVDAKDKLATQWASVKSGRF